MSFDRPTPRKEQATISLKKYKHSETSVWVELLCAGGADHGTYKTQRWKTSGRLLLARGYVFTNKNA